MTKLAKLTLVDAVCESCGHEFEDYIHDTEERLECPKCKGTAAPQLTKVYPHPVHKSWQVR